MTIKIIGAGFGRTGTSSLQTALEKLGFAPCYHMEDVMQRPHESHIWREAAVNGSVDWVELFHDYQATVDWPGAAFYRELLQAYPGAKVILSVRDPESWYASMYNTIYQDQLHPEMWIDNDWPLEIDDMVKAVIWQGTFNGRFEDKAYALELFHQHIEDVKKTVPAGDLLIYQVKEGWGPLCRFLDAPVPDEPFPYTNTTAEYLAEV